MATHNRQGIIIILLVAIILVLLGVIAYSYLLKPAINGYIVEKQTEAKDVVLSTLLAQVEQQGYAQIFDKSGNSIILVQAKTAEGIEGTQ